MNREEKIANLVQRWIPDELRLDTRHDARLVSSAITTVIMAVYDSDRMTMVGQSSDVSAALKTWFETTFAEHMRAEDDHMQSLEEKASRAMPVVSIVDSYEEIVDEDTGTKVAHIDYMDTRKPDERLTTESRFIASENQWEARLPGFRGMFKASTPLEAFAKAVQASGAMVRQ